jgi:DNA-binding NarL/FixJ family response regulator
VDDAPGSAREHDHAMATGQSSAGPAVTLQVDRARQPARDVAVLVADDCQPFRDALSELINRLHGFNVVGQATSGEEAADAVAALAPQLVLMDVIMPGMGGVAAARQILSRDPPPVVVLISVDDPAAVPGAKSLRGPVAFLRKQDLHAATLRELWEARHR